MIKDSRMALVSCPECGNRISEFAESCNNCAYPIAKLNNAGNSVNLNQHSKNEREPKVRTNTMMKWDWILYISLIIIAILQILVFSIETHSVASPKIQDVTSQTDSLLIPSTKRSEIETSTSIATIEENYINEWLLKVSDVDFNLEKNKILFSTESFEDELNYINKGIKKEIKKIDFTGPTGDGNETVQNPKINYYSDYIEIAFENGWNHRVFITANLVLHSVHMERTGVTEFYGIFEENKKQTAPQTGQDFEVLSINGNEAKIVSAVTNAEGAFESVMGTLNLSSFIVKWDN